MTRATLLASIAPLLTCCTLAAGLSAATELPERTPDGRFNTPCYAWGEDSSRALCRVSFYRLIAVPEKYDGKLVAVTGYLVRVLGEPLLFPSESSYKASAQSEGVVLLDASLPKEILSDLDSGVFPVLVVGEFDAKVVGRGLSLLGGLRNVHTVERLVHLPPSKP